jgi:hypothetical protein
VCYPSRASFATAGIALSTVLVAASPLFAPTAVFRAKIEDFNDSLCAVYICASSSTDHFFHAKA